MAPRFIETAREEAVEAGVGNVRFEVCDVQVAEFDERFDYAFSRCGTDGIVAASSTWIVTARAPAGE